MAPPKRTLFLHLSALSDAEYNSYAEALRDILDDEEMSCVSDEELETRSVAIPVVRAWMKGRFRDVQQIDKVLQLFAPQISRKEMSGGQLLAALRLLMHVRRGGDVSEANVFIQAEPSSPTVSRNPTFVADVKLASEPEPPTTDAPPSSPKSGPLHQKNPFVHGSNVASLAPPNDAGADPLRRASLSSASDLPPAIIKPRIDSIGVPSGSTNPFLQRAKTHSGSYGQPNSAASGRIPPLPPRKPAHMSFSSMPARPPPIPAKSFQSIPLHPADSSNSSSSLSSSPTAKSPPPVPPHRVTPLMQQSLLASRVGASLKRAQEEAGRIRVLEVIRSSSDTSAARSVGKDRDRTQSSSRSPDKGTRRPVPQPPRTVHPITTAKSDSGAPSVASLAEIASARLTRSRFRTWPESPDHHSSSSDGEGHISSRIRQLSSDQFSPPPTHPARRPSAHASGHSRHLRSPSYQPYVSQHSSAAGASSINKSVSASGVSESNNRSSSPSPSPSPVSPTHVRPTRSQSLRQPSSPSYPGQLTESDSTFRFPQRKRPESAQFASHPSAMDPERNTRGDLDPVSPFANSYGVQREDAGDNGGSTVSSMAARFDKTAQHIAEQDKERNKDRESHAFASLQRTFSVLQQRAQPAITRARFKAEAGFLAPRRGFVPNGRDYHMAGEDGDRLVSQNSTGDEGGMDLTPETDQGYDDDADRDSTVRSRGRSRIENAKQDFNARDDLKLPEGEGWTRL
ncbi:hypothetical protein ACEPAI_4524 [Sanghuangporus weigelae]